MTPNKYKEISAWLKEALAKETRVPALDLITEAVTAGFDRDDTSVTIATLLSDHELSMDDQHYLSVPVVVAVEDLSLKEPVPQRVRFYNIMMDTERTDGKAVRARAAVKEGRYGPDFLLEAPTDDHPANLVSSLFTTDGKHRPALDIDIPCELVPSSTPGHYHLYFPTLALEWEKYRLLLDVLAYVGIIEDGFRGAASANRQTLVRLPDVKKSEKDIVAPKKYNY